MSHITLLSPKILRNFSNQENKLEMKVNIPVNDGNVLCHKSETEVFTLPENQRPLQTKPDKVFKLRNSLLTDMLETKDFRSLYNIFAIGVVGLYLHGIINDLNERGTVNLGLNLIVQNFNRMPLLLGIWFCMQIAVILLFYGFSIWASVRLKYLPKSSFLRSSWDYFFICLLFASTIPFVFVPTYEAVVNSLPIASTAAVLIEQIRFFFKSWSFLRTVIPRVLSCKNHDSDCNCVSSISKYFYFLLVPTLIYKDEYPRTKTIRKLFLISRLIETVFIVLFVAFIFERYLLPPLRNFQSVQMNSLQLVCAVCVNLLPSFVLFLITFYALCQSGFNVIAECTRFGDRLSYRDWWNATSYLTFFRTWNILVQDWLYLYIYKDSYFIFKSRILSIGFVFIISAVLHEYILAFSFGFLYPVCTVLFVFIGMAFVFLPKSDSFVLGNIIFWVLNTIGFGVMSTLYISEYYSRLNCPSNIESPAVDFFVPRSWTCSTY